MLLRLKIIFFSLLLIIFRESRIIFSQPQFFHSVQQLSACLPLNEKAATIWWRRNKTFQLVPIFYFHGINFLVFFYTGKYKIANRIVFVRVSTLCFY